MENNKFSSNVLNVRKPLQPLFFLGVYLLGGIDSAPTTSILTNQFPYLLSEAAQLIFPKMCHPKKPTATVPPSFDDEDWEDCFNTPSPSDFEDDTLSQKDQQCPNENKNETNSPKTATLLEEFLGPDPPSSPSSPHKASRKRRFAIREPSPSNEDANALQAEGPTGKKQKTTQAEGPTEKKPEKTPSVGGGTVSLATNIFYLLAKHGNTLRNMPMLETRSQVERERVQSLRLWWSCEHDWTFPSILKDLSPWQTPAEHIKDIWETLILKEVHNVSSADMLLKRKALENLDLLQADWEHFTFNRMLTWQKRGMVLNGSVPKDLLSTEVQSLEWNNNSCAYDALCFIIPGVCHSALKAGLYVAEGMSFSMTCASRLVAALHRLSKEKQPTIRKRMGDWIRHLVQDLYEFAAHKKPTVEARWTAFQTTSFRELNEVLHLMPVLMGCSYMYNTAPAIKFPTSIFFVSPEDLVAERTKSDSFAELFYYYLKKRGTQLGAGLYFVQISDFIFRTGGNVPRKSKLYDHMSALLKKNKSFTFESEYIQYNVAICAHIGFRDKRYDHFVSAYWKSPKVIVYHDGLKRRGMASKQTPSQIYSLSKPMIVIPASKVLLIVARK